MNAFATCEPAVVSLVELSVQVFRSFQADKIGGGRPIAYKRKFLQAIVSLKDKSLFFTNWPVRPRDLPLPWHPVVKSSVKSHPGNHD